MHPKDMDHQTLKAVALAIWKRKERALNRSENLDLSNDERRIILHAYWKGLLPSVAGQWVEDRNEDYWP